MTGFEDLPEGCISSILSRTTPVDAGRLSVVSKTFLSAADSDAVWNHFLPSDLSSIIPRWSSFIGEPPSKKVIYLALADRPLTIDNGKKSFQLDRKSGNKCYMLAARSLAITWGDDHRYWHWTTMPGSRFPEVANLYLVWWLEIRGMINNLALSPNTQYAAYLVYKLFNGNNGFENIPVELSVGVEGGHSSTKIVCLDPNGEGSHYRRHGRYYGRADIVVGLPRPSVRSDGWLEIEMGEFFNSGLENEEVQMSVIEIKAGEPKGKFVLEGIEVRPKVHN